MCLTISHICCETSGLDEWAWNQKVRTRAGDSCRNQNRYFPNDVYLSGVCETECGVGGVGGLENNGGSCKSRRSFGCQLGSRVGGVDEERGASGVHVLRTLPACVVGCITYLGGGGGGGGGEGCFTLITHGETIEAHRQTISEFER